MSTPYAKLFTQELRYLGVISTRVKPLVSRTWFSSYHTNAPSYAPPQARAAVLQGVQRHLAQVLARRIGTASKVPAVHCAFQSISRCAALSHRCAHTLAPMC